jgi:TonB-linked SusC/RagA family outer membrane protein
MKGYKYLLKSVPFIILLTFTVTQAHAQQINVHGTVKDAQTGKTLPGVNILVKGTTVGSFTNTDGKFKLTAPSTNDTLRFSFIGYKTKEVAINGREDLGTITLQSNILVGKQLVVTGYETKQRNLVTGAVSQISGAEITETPTVNVEKGLEGKIPGLVISNRGGQPGTPDMKILIRGKESFGSNSPLVIVDGVPATTEDLENVSADNVANISVLKGASAAVYGARSANGVIVVTTKRGAKGASNITINASTGFATPTILPKLMNAAQYAEYKDEMQERYGQLKSFSKKDIELFKNGDEPLTHPNTNWYDLTLQKTTPQRHFNVAGQGGTDNVQYYISGDYSHKGSLFKGGEMFYNKFQIRSNIDAQVMKYLKIGFDLSGRLKKIHQPAQPATYLFHLVQLSLPTAVGIYPNGLPGYAAVGLNPMVGVTNKAGFNNTDDRLFNSKLSVDLDLSWITKGLSLSGIAAFNYDENDNKIFWNTWPLYKYNPETKKYDKKVGSNSETAKYSTLNQTDGHNRQQYYNIKLEYKNSYRNNNFHAFFAYELQQDHFNNLNGWRRGLTSDQIIQLDQASTLNQRTGGTAIDSLGRVSYFGTFDYNYKQKYLLSFTLRHDGSFNFPTGHRFGTFPSVTAGWNISKEPFMAGAGSWLNNLKIRAGYSVEGYDQVPSFQFLTKYQLSSETGYYIFGEDHKRFNGFFQINTPNPNITWEIARDWDIGLDASLFRNRFNFSFDYFIDHRRRILIAPNGAVPEYTGLSLPDENLGKVNNHGIGFQSSFKSSAGNWGYSVGGNVSYNKNEIIYMAEPKGIPAYQRQTGHPLGSYLVYKTDGIFHTQQEVNNTKAKFDGTKPGDIKYVDVNGDGEITGLDRVRVYSSPIPKVQFGISAGMKYKGFNLNGFFQGQALAKNYISHDRGALSNEPIYLYKKRWTKGHKNATYPRAYDRNDFYNYAHQSTFWLYDAAFVRLKNLTLSYNLPVTLLAKTSFNQIQVYLRGYNIWTWDKMAERMGGYYVDPELNGGSGAGSQAQGKYYPQQKIFEVGVRLKL